MRLRSTLPLLHLALFLALACRSTGPSATLEAPRVDQKPVSQSSPFPENNCGNGGLAATGGTGQGWNFDPRMGCELRCKNIKLLKDDFLQQLRTHRIYGDAALLEARDPQGAAIARYYQERQTKMGLNARPFAQVTREQLFSGKEWRTLKDPLQPGDVLLYMAFGTPNRAGAFYSKRGITHAALVVHINAEGFITLDSGATYMGLQREVNSQVIWLRPKPELLSESDRKNLGSWAKAMAPLPYDNLLIDDLKNFREELHARLDAGFPRAEALKQAFAAAERGKFAPLSLKDSLSFRPPSGLYCSEGVAHIFSYLGFRQYGDTPIELVTAFNAKGNLPEWDIYRDALDGFNAGAGPALVMHQTFWNYFRIFESSRKLGLFKIPGYGDAKAGSFAEAMHANLKAVNADKLTSDHIDKQLEQAILGLQNLPEQAVLKAEAEAVRQGLKEVAKNLSQGRSQPLNTSQAAYAIFMENKAYGPHTFLENSRYFDFKGVFYNTDAKSGAQARYVADLEQRFPGSDESFYINISTTLYSLEPEADLPVDRCVLGEKLTFLSTGPVGEITAPYF